MFIILPRYYAAGEFDTYPPEVKGGSILIIRGETKTPSEFADFIAKRRKMSPEQIKKVRCDRWKATLWVGYGDERIFKHEMIP